MFMVIMDMIVNCFGEMLFLWIIYVFKFECI